MNDNFKEIFNISDHTYNRLQYCQRIIIPSALTAIGTIGLALGYEQPTALIVTIGGAINLFIGNSLNISSKIYQENK